jgi:cysteine synthase
MPDKMSKEKQAVQEALGAEIVRTPTEAPHDGRVARDLEDVVVDHWPSVLALGFGRCNISGI